MTTKLPMTIAAVGLLGAVISCSQQKPAGPPPEPMARWTTNATEAKPADNAFCLVCHEYLTEEKITQVHAALGVLCVDCHGSSSMHMEDELLMTKPDVLFGRREVPYHCAQCHTRHNHPDRVAEFRKEWEGRDRPNGRVISSQSICTDCHGTHNLVKQPQSQQAGAAQWTPLFNGQDLTGWKAVGKAKWIVENGALVGMQGENGAAGDLFTEAEFKDFLLTATFRIDWPANSGIWFRYQSANAAYQADILEYKNPVCYTGSLYCMGKRFIALNENKDLVKRDGWNTLKVRAEGNHLQIWLNGQKVADVHDNASDRGKIGLQIHPGDAYAKMKITIREIAIQPLVSQ